MPLYVAWFWLVQLTARRIVLYWGEKKWKWLLKLKARSKEWHKRKVKVTQKMITGGCCTETIERKLTLENVKMESYWKSRKRKNAHTLRRGAEEFEHCWYMKNVQSLIAGKKSTKIKLCMTTSLIKIRCNKLKSISTFQRFPASPALCLNQELWNKSMAVSKADYYEVEIRNVFVFNSCFQSRIQWGGTQK